MDIEQATEIISKNFPSYKIKNINESSNYFIVELESKGSRMDLLHKKQQEKSCHMIRSH